MKNDNKYGLKGEYEEQRATVLLYPYRDDIWRKNCEPIAEMIVKLANEISAFQPVILGVLPSLMKKVKGKYTFNEGVTLTSMEYNDIWARDSISSLVYKENGEILESFGFNAYGGRLYHPWNKDQSLSKQISSLFGYEYHEVPIVLEGGNIMPDGNGTIFLVEDAILNDNRNPGLTKEKAEKLLKDITLSKQIVWLPHGVVNDETGGHIDNVMAFADKDTLLLSWTDDPSNEHYEAVRSIYDILRSAKNIDGKAYHIVKLPIPKIYHRTKDDSDGIEYAEGSFSRLEGDPILDTYINFALVNGAVIVPQFHIELDQVALDILKNVFPDRKLIPFYSREASLGGGGLHCLSKHIN